MYSPKELSSKLKGSIPDTSFLNTLKIAYRPYICPFDRLLTLIPEGKKVYDLGCGSGMFLMLVAEYRQPVKLGGTEISAGLIENANSLLAPYNIETELEVYDGVKLPENISNFDIVFLIDVFHHIPSEYQTQFLKSLYSKMKPGSRLIFKDIDASKKILVKMNKLHDMLLAGEVGNEISMEEAVSRLADCGFKIVQKEYQRVLWYPHFLIVCEK